MNAWPKVGFVAGTLGRGGAERQLWEQCRVLVEDGVPPVVVSFTSGEHWQGALRDLGVEVCPVGSRGGRLGRSAAIVRRLAGKGVDVVQASHGMANLYAVLAGRALRRPSVGALRTTPDRVVAAQGRLGGPALRWPDRLAGNSERNLDAARSFGVAADRCHLLPNVVDLDRFRPDDASRSAGDDGPGSTVAPPTFTFVGRLGPEKRVDVLVDALAVLAARGTEVEAVVVGDGPLREDLVARAVAKRVHDRLRFVGVDDRPERWIRPSRALVLPSEREGTPNVVLEALACGVPVVATPVGDVAELVGDAGAIVPVGDVAAMADAIERLALDPATWRTAAARARGRAEARAGRPALTAAMVGLYAGFAGDGRPCAA